MLKDLLFFNLPILKSKIRIMFYGTGTYDIIIYISIKIIEMSYHRDLET